LFGFSEIYKLIEIEQYSANILTQKFSAKDNFGSIASRIVYSSCSTIVDIVLGEYRGAL
jgi:hypothetical protein